MNKNMNTDAIAFYSHVLELGLAPDKFTFPSLFKSCHGCVVVGRQVHGHVVKMGLVGDRYVQNTMISMYSSCGLLGDSREVFDKMADKSVVSWATIIASYTECGEYEGALCLFRKMLGEGVGINYVTLVNVLAACGLARDLETAKLVHECIRGGLVESNAVLVTALLDAYCKCGCLEIARELFCAMPEKNSFAWNIMIHGLVQGSEYKEALALFREMQVTGVKASKETVVTLLLACSHLAALDLGRWLHLYVRKENIEIDLVLGTALVDMYGKCGCFESALQVFDALPLKDVMSWTAVISNLAMCGQGKKALALFHKMQESGLRPDAVTFVGVLSACSHGGLVEEGYAHFQSMSGIYKIKPTVEHYGCMVDMLGRAGRVEETEKLIESMPMAADYYVMGSLLSACRVHGKLEVAERVARRIVDLYPCQGGSYVLLSNIYSSLGRWDDVKKTRELMIERGVKKPPGCSSIEIDGTAHEFVMGDTSHPETDNIYAMLEVMMSRLKVAGYLPDKSKVLLDMDEEEKEDSLCRHSEKIAIAYGLLSTCPGTRIRVVKNLRVCNDCHAAIKLISRVYKREITVRDRSRFHYFKDGSCSCKDFW